MAEGAHYEMWTPKKKRRRFRSYEDSDVGEWEADKVYGLDKHRRRSFPKKRKGDFDVAGSSSKPKSALNWIAGGLRIAQRELQRIQSETKEANLEVEAKLLEHIVSIERQLENNFNQANDEEDTCANPDAQGNIASRLNPEADVFVPFMTGFEIPDCVHHWSEANGETTACPDNLNRVYETCGREAEEALDFIPNEFKHDDADSDCADVEPSAGACVEPAANHDVDQYPVEEEGGKQDVSVADEQDDGDVEGVLNEFELPDVHIQGENAVRLACDICRLVIEERRIPNRQRERGLEKRAEIYKYLENLCAALKIDAKDFDLQHAYRGSLSYSIDDWMFLGEEDRVDEFENEDIPIETLLDERLCMEAVEKAFRESYRKRLYDESEFGS